MLSKCRWLAGISLLVSDLNNGTFCNLMPVHAKLERASANLASAGAVQKGHVLKVIFGCIIQSIFLSLPHILLLT